MRASFASFARFFVLIVAVLSLAFSSLYAADGRFDRTLPVTDPLKVDVLSDTGCISVRSGQPGKIEIHARMQSIDDSGADDIEARIRAIEQNPPITSDPKGHNVRIGHFGNPDATRNISICYEIVAPSETQLRSETGAGDQTIEGIQGPVDANSGSGNLRVWHIGRETHVSTGSGDIDLRDVHGHVQAKTGTGTIHASEIRGELPNSTRPGPQLVSTGEGRQVMVNLTEASADLQIITGSGDVDVENLEGGLEVTSGSGNIKASGKPASNWQLDTGAGTVRVIFPTDSNLALIAHTSSGIIKSNDAITVRGPKNPHQLHGQVGKGGPTVDLKTASGDIEIQ